MPRPRGRAGRRTDYDWEGAFIAQTSLNSGVSAQFAIGVADSAETLMRVRGTVAAILDQTGTTAADAAIVGFGLMVASTGATLAVAPVTEPGANWLWHTFILLATEFALAAGNNELLNQARVEIDNKAMRKLREDETLFLVVENTNINGSPIVSVNGAFRILTGR